MIDKVVAKYDEHFDIETNNKKKFKTSPVLSFIGIYRAYTVWGMGGRH